LGILKESAAGGGFEVSCGYITPAELVAWRLCSPDFGYSSHASPSLTS